jgi:hypothetical protein
MPDLMEPFRPLPWAPTPNHPAVPMPLVSWRIVDPRAPCAPPVMAAAGVCTPHPETRSSRLAFPHRCRLPGKCIDLSLLVCAHCPLLHPPIPSRQRITLVAVRKHVTEGPSWLLPFIEAPRRVSPLCSGEPLSHPHFGGTEVAHACCVSGSHEGRAMIAHSLVLRTGLFIAVHVGLLAGVLLLL